MSVEAIQRNDWACKLARCVVKSSDFVAFEDLQVRNMVRNRKLAKSITDASWSMFRRWLEYFGTIYGVVTVPVPPQYTSQKCSSCGAIVKKTLSQRTHKSLCGASLCRDENAAKNILELGLRNAGHVLTSVLVRGCGRRSPPTFIRPVTENACGHDDLYYCNGNGVVASRVAEAGKSQGDLGIPLLKINECNELI